MTKSSHKPGRQREWEAKLFPGTQYSADLVWRNILNPDSLRLTGGAYNLLKKDKTIVFYHFAIDGVSSLQLLQLDRLLKSPYFLKSRKQIELLGEEDAIMLTLHANNLAQYLSNLVDQ